MCAHFWLAGESNRAVESGHRALADAKAHGDFALQVVANLRLGMAYLSQGDHHRAGECFQTNIESLEGELIRERFGEPGLDRESTRLNSSHGYISYAVFCLKKKKKD